MWAGKQVSRCSLTNDISFTLPGVSIQNSQDNETSVFTDRVTSVYLTSIVKLNTGPWWKLGQGSCVSNLSNVYSSPIIFFSLLIWSGLAQYLIAIGTRSSIQVIFNIHGIAEQYHLFPQHAHGTKTCGTARQFIFSSFQYPPLLHPQNLVLNQISFWWIRWN